MADSYDLVVIGSGAAATTAAYECRADGWTVALVDKQPFGGTCGLRGCDPKKVLVAATEALESVRRLQGKGVEAGEARIDWPHLMAFKESFTDPVPESKARAFKEAGIDAMQGTARFTGPRTLRVGDRELEAKHVLLAAGAKPVPLPIEGAEHLRTSTDFLSLPDLPRRIVFVGGGYVSMEFAHVAARAGAHVTILHRGGRLLEPFDADVVEALAKHTRELGVEVRTGADVKRIEKRGDAFRVHYASKEGDASAEADAVFHGAGRVPDVDELDLEKGNVERSRRGIVVDEHLRSVSNPIVFAAGDCADSGGLPLTPVASMEGRVVSANLRGGHERADYHATPSVVFTTPPLAMVGLTEEAAREQGVPVRVNTADASSWMTARRRGETCYAYKVLVHEETGHVVGAHLVGTHAEEAINVLALMMRFGIPAEEARRLPWTYPTSTYDLSYMV